MLEKREQWPREVCVPIAAGVAWLWFAASGGVAGFFLALVPGVLLVAAGAASTIWPADRRSTQVAALGGVVGMLFLLPGIFVLGLGAALFLFLLSAAAFVACGALSLRLEPPCEKVPEPIPSLALAAKVALDEALLATMQVTVSTPSAADAERIPAEVDAARAYFDSRGWIEKPAEYHRTPLPLEAPQIRQAQVWGPRGRVQFEALSFESEYEPEREEPGRERWLSYANNRSAHAWVLRHRDRDRPWLMCIHGYQMGSPFWDLRAFDTRYYHEELGLNMVLPVLPLHGPRKLGRRSGNGFLSGDPLDTVHAEAQAIWDIRRLLSWVRSQGSPAVGVHGLSLGAYTTALLASLDDGLACAILAVPPADLANLLWRHGPVLQVQHREHRGVVHDEVAELFRVISPLALEPVIPLERRAIYGGVSDRLVPPEQVHALWEHWDRPAIEWYQGAHLTGMFDSSVRNLLETTLRESGLVA